MVNHNHIPGPMFEVAKFKAGDSITWFKKPGNQSSLYRPQSIYPLSMFYIEAVEILGDLPRAPLVLWINNFRVLALLPDLCRAAPVVGRARGYELSAALTIAADWPFDAQLMAPATTDGSAALILHGRGYRKRDLSTGLAMPRPSQGEAP